MPRLKPRRIPDSEITVSDPDVSVPDISTSDEWPCLPTRDIIRPATVISKPRTEDILTPANDIVLHQPNEVVVPPKTAVVHYTQASVVRLSPTDKPDPTPNPPASVPQFSPLIRPSPSLSSDRQVGGGAKVYGHESFTMNRVVVADTLKNADSEKISSLPPVKPKGEP